MPKEVSRDVQFEKLENRILARVHAKKSALVGGPAKAGNLTFKGDVSDID